MKPPANATIRELFTLHSDAMLLYARQWLDAAEAEEVVQQVFLKLLRGSRLPEESRTWLFRCVRNAAIGVWRSNRRRRRRELNAAQGASSWFATVSDETADAEAIEDAMRQLAPIEREIVILRIWSGLTLAQISEQTGLAVSAVHTQYRNALKTMRCRMERTCKSPPR